MKQFLALGFCLFLFSLASAVSVTVTGLEEILMEPQTERYSADYLKDTTVYELDGAETGRDYGILHIDKTWNTDDVAIDFDREIEFDLRRFPEEWHMFVYSTVEYCDFLDFRLENHYPKHGMRGRKDLLYLPSHTLSRHSECGFKDKIQLIVSSTEDGLVCVDYDYSDLQLEDGDSLMFDELTLYVNSRSVEGELDDHREYWAGRGIKCPTWTGEVTYPEPEEDEPTEGIEPAASAPEPTPEPTPAETIAPDKPEAIQPPVVQPKESASADDELPTEGWQGVFVKVLQAFFDFADWLGRWLS